MLFLSHEGAYTLMPYRAPAELCVNIDKYAHVSRLCCTRTYTNMRKHTQEQQQQLHKSLGESTSVRLDEYSTANAFNEVHMVSYCIWRLLCREKDSFIYALSFSLAVILRLSCKPFQPPSCFPFICCPVEAHWSAS